MARMKSEDPSGKRSVQKSAGSTPGSQNGVIDGSSISAMFNELADCIEELVLVFDARLRVIMANRRALVLLGYSESDLGAMRLTLLLEKGERRAMHGFVQGTEERRSGETTFLTQSRHKIRVRFSLSLLTARGGSTRYYLFVGNPLDDKSESRIATTVPNGLAERMLRGFADPLFIIDGRSRTVLDCNSSALAVLGYSREELIGWRLLGHAVSEEERKHNKALMERADKAYATSGIFQERLLFHRKKGPALPCDFIGLPFFNADGSLSFVIALLFDRSSEEDREAELGLLLDRAKGLASDLAAIVNCPAGGETRRLSALGFTPRQVEIARLVAMGASSKDIGFRLGIAESTVRNHLAAMFRKLGVDSRMSFMHVLTEQRIRIA